MRIEYKGIALRDIQQKRDYIVNTLKNRSAAQKLVYSILNAVSQLSENPYMGPLLSSKYDVDSDIRFLVVSKQMVFYRGRKYQRCGIVAARIGDRIFASFQYNGTMDSRLFEKNPSRCLFL